MKPYGMPHLGAHYEGLSVNSYEADNVNIPCACCGGLSSETHHEPQKGLGGGGSYVTYGGVQLRPALIRLCQRCHAERHRGSLKIEWVWNDECTEAEWKSGFTIKRGLKPHDPALFEVGHYEFRRNGEVVREVRSPDEYSLQILW